jgi:hypothetical protein
MRLSGKLLGIVALTWLTMAITSGCQGSDGKVRPAAFAGQFYPSDPARLRSAIQGYIRDALVLESQKTMGIIVPHAGYIFSGQIAADGYRQVQGQAYDIIVILGTNHTAAEFKGISIIPSGAFRTPLGDAEIDEQFARALLAQDSDCSPDESPQKQEHSVEVQIPFIQVLFPKARIVPVVIGEPDLQICTRFGEVLARIAKNRKALIVASSDLSHYPGQADASRIDRQTLEALSKLDPAAFDKKTRSLLSNPPPGLATCACGAGPIMAILSAARKLGATHAAVASYANSGDTSIGDRERTVGYGAVLLAAGTPKAPERDLLPGTSGGPASPLQSDQKRVLLKIARETLHRYLTTDTVPLIRNVPPRLQVQQGVFVTLKKHGELRGCVGNMSADFPLARAVGQMAMQSAFNDQRFPPLRLPELEEVEIEISALTPMKQVAGPEAIVPGRDGVLIQKGSRSAVFLPQVASENHWGREEMLDNLCRKAGLPAGSWKKETRFFTFQSEVFEESHFK